MQLSVTDLVLTSALPVLEVVLMCLVGAIAVWKVDVLSLDMSSRARTLRAKQGNYDAL